MSIIQPALRWLALATTMLATAAGLSSLTACGGDTTPVDCSQYVVVLTYAGPATGASLPFAQNLADATVGQPMSIPAPTLPKNDSSAPAPASCVSGVTWSAGGLPPGVAIDPHTGALSGTPTQGGYFSAFIQIAAATPSIQLGNPGIWFQVRDPATTRISAWDAGRPLPAGAGQLATQGGDLVWLQSGAMAMELRRSHDGGATWTLDTPAHAPPVRQQYTVATDASGRLYLADGYVDPNIVSTALGDLWVYDGADWTQLFIQAPYTAPAEEQAVLYVADGALFALNSFEDALWRSADGGLSWTKVDSDLQSTVNSGAFRPLCGGNLGGKQVIIGNQLTDFIFEPVSLRTFQSADGGVTWTEVVDTELPTLGTMQCQFAGSSVFLAVGYDAVRSPTVIATSDLASWALQAYRPDWSQLSGLVDSSAALGSTVYFAFADVLYTGTP